MIQRMLSSALIAGCAAGLLAVLLHFAFVESLILLAEDYETGARVHFQGVVAGDGQALAHDDAHNHDHAASDADAAGVTAAPPPEPAGHQHGAAEAEVPPLQRHSLSVLFAVLTYAGYGLLLVAGFALAEEYGHPVARRDGVLWGLAGFAALQLAPAMGLAPELPGTAAAELEARQLWWVGTALATAGGIGLMAYGRTALAWGAAVVLIALPHLIGAPALEGFSGVTPPELAAGFAARALGVSLIAWLALGAMLARLWGARGLPGGPRT